MSLLIGFESTGLPPSTISALDDIIAPIQTWAGKADGLNAQFKSDLTGLEGRLSPVPAGALFMWVTSTAPSGYLLCDGTAVSRIDFAALFSVINVTYGSGNGSTTFNVPDMRQKFPLGVAVSGTGSTLAGTGGDVDHTHHGPSHTHASGTLAATNTNLAHTHSGTTATEGSHTHSFTTGVPPEGHQVVKSGTGVNAAHVTHTHTGTTAAGSAHSHTFTSGSASADMNHDHGTSGDTAAGGTASSGTGNPPFLALNFIVKT